MKNSPARGRDLAPLAFEVVPLPAPAPVDRASMETAQQRELPEYCPFPLGRKLRLARQHLVSAERKA